MAIFEGTFTPPVIGTKEAPIKIAGPGICETTPFGLKIVGFKQKPKVKTCQLLALFFGLFFGIIIIKATLLPALPDNLAVTIPFAVAVYPFIKGQGSDYQKGEAIELVIPWENILYARQGEMPNVVIIRIQKLRHQGERYQGALFFNPAQGATVLLNALHSCSVKVKD